jgi:hypothetical protein
LRRGRRRLAYRLAGSPICRLVGVSEGCWPCRHTRTPGPSLQRPLSTAKARTDAINPSNAGPLRRSDRPGGGTPPNAACAAGARMRAARLRRRPRGGGRQDGPRMSAGPAVLPFFGPRRLDLAPGEAPAGRAPAAGRPRLDQPLVRRLAKRVASGLDPVLGARPLSLWSVRTSVVRPAAGSSSRTGQASGVCVAGPPLTCREGVRARRTARAVPAPAQRGR